MKKIPLTQGQFALVDDEDYERLARHKWHARWERRTNSFYAARWMPHPDGGTRRSGSGLRQTVEGMSRAVLGLKRGDSRQVDHVNHDTLDNRRENLRVVTNRQNGENRRDQSPHGAGVYYSPNRPRPFGARAVINGHTRYLGRFATAEEAREARERAIEKLRKEAHADHEA